MFTEKTWERLAQYGDNLLTALLVLAAGLLFLDISGAGAMIENHP